MHERIAIIGECMLEMNLDSDYRNHHDEPRLAAGLSFGGDTLNTALYMSRLGAEVDYVTALGNDHLSDWMIRQWKAEGIGCDLVMRVENSTPGLYLIETDDSGERTFHYWRDRSPARRLLDNASVAHELFEKLREVQAIYLSGISLAIFSPYARECLFNFLAEYRRTGGKVIFDGNYRPRLWGSETLTRIAYEKVYSLTDIALPTLEDELALFGSEADDDSVAADKIIERLQHWGVAEVVLKMGADGCLVAARNSDPKLIPSHQVTPVDTTAAGDSFNAGFLASKLAGDSLEQAAVEGHQLAAAVIQHRGAIIPRTAMPAREASN
ncbi:2-dehydro-3-deoxygluconokinase [Microbulbifer donghaiensis]|uniref:2-dehydro-3-deoxygluconokinase n=1 Tax=Microbulbifer donghaiensis TaxID=494016 RepID=A0A1M5F9Y9_9GAMM|nr:sugar kinase [Microbulbifer donghaiensis]SHF88364.1 2-dehydro-3-deoxygluconokinase [Microbulbifer donghaiensis]